jgi:hypothetical protein
MNRARLAQQMHPAWRALLQNIELMPQDQDFSFEPLARL